MILLGVFFFLNFQINAEAFEFIIRGSVSEMYDDNIAQTEQNRIDDFVTNLMLGAGFRHEGSLHTIELLGHVTQQLYFENHDFNRNIQDVAFDYRGVLSRFDRVHIANIYSHSYEPLTFDQAFATNQGRYERYRNYFDFNYSRDLGSRFTVNGRYNNEIITTTNPLLNDLVIHRPGIQIDYSLGTANVFSVFYNYILINTEEHESARIHRTGLGHRYYFTRRLYMENRGGPDFIQTMDGVKYTRPYILSTIVGNIDEGFRGSILYDRHTIMSEYNQEIFDSQRVSGSLEKQIYRNFWITFTGFHGRGRYIPSDIENTFTGLAAAFIYRYREYNEASVRYTRVQSDSTQAGMGYKRNIWEAGVAISF